MTDLCNNVVPLHPERQEARKALEERFKNDRQRERLLTGFDYLIDGNRPKGAALLFSVPLWKVADMVSICREKGVELRIR